jgi:succinoglycan biosynthesis protein ExoH
MTNKLIHSEQTSAAIRIIRPLLIIFMTFAHITILQQAPIMADATPLDLDNWLTVFLKAAVAKSGVPLLSLISGYLAVASLEKYGYPGLLVNKAKRLIWPLFWSNLLFIILIIYPAQGADPNERPDLLINPFNFYGWFQAVFAFYKLPANQPLYFLKDLYTCFLLIPVLIFLARIKYIQLIVILWMAYKCIYLKTAFIFPVFPLWFFRFDIVLAFYLGILLFLSRKSLLFESTNFNRSLIFLYLLVCGLVSVIYVVYPGSEHATLFLWLDFIVKVVSVTGCIAVMSLLSSRQGNLSRLFAYLSPFSYILFLTHVFTFTFFNRIYFHYFPMPDFFRLNGSLYFISILLSAILMSIALHLFWFRLIAPRLPARTWLPFGKS